MLKWPQINSLQQVLKWNLNNFNRLKLLIVPTTKDPAIKAGFFVEQQVYLRFLYGFIYKQKFCKTTSTQTIQITALTPSNRLFSPHQQKAD